MATSRLPDAGIALTEPLAGYLGNKGQSGVAARIISEMPPHDCYVEPFAGSARVARLKRPASINVLFDLNQDTVLGLKNIRDAGELRNFIIHDTSGFHAMDDFPLYFSKGGLAYFDPPYPAAVRSRDRYKKDMRDDDAHRALLLRITALPCMVIISSYDNEIYNGILSGWRRVEIPTITRGGPRTEVLWCNFETPTYLHDPRFAGRSARERWKIRERCRRWNEKYLAFPPAERQLLLDTLAASDDEVMWLRSSRSK